MKKTAKALVTLLFCLSLLSATLIPAFAASQVKNFKATSITYNSAKLTWSKVSKASKYVVERQSGKNWKAVSTVKTNSCTVSKLTTGTTYKYRVTAKNWVGRNIAVSKTISVKPMPAKVTKLKVASVTYNSAKLTWAKVAGATGYTVQRYNASSKKWVKAANVKTNSYTAKKLKINTTYKFRVAAYRTVSKKNYYGAYSSNISAKPVLGQAKNFKASVVSPTSIKLTWSKVANAKGYYVQQYVNKKWKNIKTLSSKYNSYSISKLTPNTTYKYRVVSYITLSKKTYTGAASSIVSVKPALGKVTGVKAAVASATSVKLSWNKLKNATGYSVQQYVGGKWKTVKSLTANSYTVTKLAPNATYKFRVLGYITVSKKNYYGAASAEVSANLKIATPGGLKTSAAAGLDNLTFSWNKVANASGYFFEISTDGKKWTAKDVGNALTYKATNLVPATSYQARVRAYVVYNSSKPASAYSAVVKTSTAKISAPASVNLDTATQQSAKISWSKVANATGYYVQQYKNSSWVDIGKVTGTSYTVNGLEENNNYKFRVVTYVVLNSAERRSLGSTVVAVSTNRSVSRIKFNQRSDSSLYIYCDVIDGATGYNIYMFDETSKKYIPVSTARPVSADSYYAGAVISNLIPSKKYTFAMDAYTEGADGTRYCTGKSADYSYTTSSKTYEVSFTPIENITNYYLEFSDGTRLSSLDTSFYCQVSEREDDLNDIEVKLVKSGNAVTASWTSMPGYSYIVQSRTNGENGMWVDECTASTNSAKLYLAPSTKYEVRVIACDNNCVYYEARPGSSEGIARFKLGKPVPRSVSKATTITTNAAPAFANNNEIKTLYALMAAQAINNTKAEQGNVKMAFKNDMTSDMLIRIQLGIVKGEFTQDELDDLLNTLKRWGILDKDEDLDLGDLDLSESTSFNGTFTNGIYSGVKNKDYTVDFLHSSITPYDGPAYLYNAHDINSFAKRITSITYKQNSDGTKTITMKLPKETANNANETTPVHNGLAQGASDLVGDVGNDAGAMKVSAGETIMTLVINKNYTLNRLNTDTIVGIDMSMSGDSSKGFIDLGVKMNCKSVSAYSFSR